MQKINLVFISTKTKNVFGIFPKLYNASSHSTNKIGEKNEQQQSLPLFAWFLFHFLMKVHIEWKFARLLIQVMWIEERCSFILGL